ncbi:unnamed protein product [Arctia plantaginis]|uniref:Uncharacterized protein n=1 Tax=Arctia plantaginis TaxID=874455 RepID=A0A8S0YLS8_ARCPL|nr:unnamed protein product [Arctia plantaginis]
MWQRSVVTRRYIVLQSARRHVVLRCGNEWWRSGTSGGTQNQPLGTSQACVTSSGCTTRRRAGALGSPGAPLIAPAPPRAAPRRDPLCPYLH